MLEHNGLCRKSFDIIIHLLIFGAACMWRNLDKFCNATLCHGIQDHIYPTDLARLKSSCDLLCL